MEKIPSTMVIHKHVDVGDNSFATMEGPLVKILWVIAGGDQNRNLTSSI